jgi:hypothetical protein
LVEPERRGEGSEDLISRRYVIRAEAAGVEGDDPAAVLVDQPGGSAREHLVPWPRRTRLACGGRTRRSPAPSSTPPGFPAAVPPADPDQLAVRQAGHVGDRRLGQRGERGAGRQHVRGGTLAELRAEPVAIRTADRGQQLRVDPVGLTEADRDALPR